MKWLRILAVALLLGAAMAAGVMLYNLGRYEKAGVCSSSTTVSRDCIARMPAVIESPPKYDKPCATDGSKCSDVYRLAARTEQGKTRNFTIVDEREDLKKGDRVELVLWNGNVIAVNANGEESYIWDWDLGLARFGLTGTIPTALVLAVMVAVMRKTPSWPKNGFAKAAAGILFFAGVTLAAFVVFTAFTAFLQMGLLV